MTDTTAVVITVSDGVSAGVRDDTSGRAVEDMLIARGFSVARELVPERH